MRGGVPAAVAADTPAWGTVASGIEDLPVPDVAVLAEPSSCEKAPPQDCEEWQMPAGVSVTAVRRWYLARVEPKSRWHERWEPCFDGRFDTAGLQGDGQETLALSWSRDRVESLFLTASSSPHEPVEIRIVRRTAPDGMACQ